MTLTISGLKEKNKYEKLKNKRSVTTGLENALKEVKDIKAGKKKAKPFSEFLNEL